MLIASAATMILLRFLTTGALPFLTVSNPPGGRRHPGRHRNARSTTKTCRVRIRTRHRISATTIYGGGGDTESDRAGGLPSRAECSGGPLPGPRRTGGGAPA